MTYIENVFVCMAAPLVVALLSLKRGQRAALVFCLTGMGACLLSAYLNTFFARLYQADAVNAATQIAPVVEEVMKLLPLLFFLAVFEPTFARFRLAAVIVAASIFSGRSLGYLVVGLLAFALGVCVTVLCVRLRGHEQDTADGERHDD